MLHSFFASQKVHHTPINQRELLFSARRNLKRYLFSIVIGFPVVCGFSFCCARDLGHSADIKNYNGLLFLILAPSLFTLCLSLSFSYLSFLSSLGIYFNLLF